VLDSEEETGPRLKPVFVRKRDRVTVIEKEREATRQKQAETEAKKMAEERRKYTLKVPELKSQVLWDVLLHWVNSSGSFDGL
jgi:hypothetical protein